MKKWIFALLVAALVLVGTAVVIGRKRAPAYPEKAIAGTWIFDPSESYPKGSYVRNRNGEEFITKVSLIIRPRDEYVELERCGRPLFEEFEGAVSCVTSPYQPGTGERQVEELHNATVFESAWWEGQDLVIRRKSVVTRSSLGPLTEPLVVTGQERFSPANDGTRLFVVRVVGSEGESATVKHVYRRPQAN